MAKSNAGRPPIINEIVVKKLEDAFVLGCTDEEACLMANISRQTLYNYQEKHPEFVDRKAQLKETPNIIARKSVIKTMEENGDLALKYLSKKKKDEFADRTELTGKDGETLAVAGFQYVQPDNTNNKTLTKPTSGVADSPR